MADRLEEKLRALQPDVDSIGLADSASVRRRGEARTRHQVMGGALATVAVLAGVVGVAGGLAGDGDRAVGPPAGEPTVTTTQEAPLALAGEPFLRDGDLRDVGPFESFRDSGREPENQLLRCIDVPGRAGAGGGERRSTVLFEPTEPTVTEHVVRFSSAALATDFVDRLRSDFADCPAGDPADARVIDRGPFDVFGGFAASRLTIPTANAGIGYYELGVTRESNVVVVLEWSSMGNPYGDDSGEWVWTTDRLRLALDRAVD